MSYTNPFIPVHIIIQMDWFPIISIIIAAYLIYLLVLTLKVRGLRIRLLYQRAEIEHIIARRQMVLDKLMQVASGYVSRDKEILKSLERLKADKHGKSLRRRAIVEMETRMAMSVLLMLCEKYISLAKNQKFKELKEEMDSLEDALAEKKEEYNECVGVYNGLVNSLSGSIIKKLFGYRENALFKVSPRDSKKLDKLRRSLSRAIALGA